MLSKTRIPNQVFENMTMNKFVSGFFFCDVNFENLKLCYKFHFIFIFTLISQLTIANAKRLSSSSKDNAVI